MRSRNWADREGNARPTPERREKSPDWILADAEDAGTSYALDQSASPILAARHSQQIDDLQWDAAERYAEIARAAKGSPNQRSCLNIDPIGYGEDGNEEAQEKYNELRRDMSFVCWREVDNVVWRENEIEHLEVLRAGLSEIVNILGLK